MDLVNAPLGAFVILSLALGCTEKDSTKKSSGLTSAEQVVSAPETRADAPEIECPSERSPAHFACQREAVCVSTDRDGPMDIYNFLCHLSDAADELAGPQRVSDLARRLPYRFRKNMTFKHGEKQGELRGHAMEVEELTTTANVEHPRVIIWDHDTGFAVSFNGGPRTDVGADVDQRSERELHMISYDQRSAEFSFWSVDLPIPKNPDGSWKIEPTQPKEKKADCNRCHGEDSRPIWAMYPDWPGVFGSDTDELTKENAHQSLEREALARFHRCVASAAGEEARDCESGELRGDPHRRYATLFDKTIEKGLDADFAQVDGAAVRQYLASRAASDPRRKPEYRLTPQAMAALDGGDDALRDWMGLRLHANYPYRPNHQLQKTEPSRAIYHRPNLRLGALYNRLNAQRIMARIQTSPVYSEFKKLVLFSLMDCRWHAEYEDARLAALSSFERAAGTLLSERGMRLVPNESKDPSDKRILYPSLMAALGLSMRDVDIRFSYPNEHFNAFDRNYSEPNYAETVMDIGYIRYRGQDNNKVNAATRYFNSYFDGSASFDELLVARILEDIEEDGKGDKVYGDLYELNSYLRKQGGTPSRYQLDKRLFVQMDGMGRWFPLPYPKHLKPLHNRQAFTGKRLPFSAQYDAVCQRLEGELAELPKVL